MGVLDFINTGLQGIAQIFNQRNQAKQWEREDNAVQRRVADLRAAGLSPVLAAGSAASSSAPMKVDAPQFSRAVEAQGANIAQTNAQRRLNELAYDINDANSLTNRIRADYLRTDASNSGHKSYDLAKSIVDREIMENTEAVRNIGIYRDYNVPSVGTAGDDIISSTGMLKNIFPGMDQSKAGGMSVLLRTLQSLIGARRR